MWKDFNQHFSSKNRDRGQRVNHHDFLDLSEAQNTHGGLDRLSLGRFGRQDSTFLGSDKGSTLGGPGDALFQGPKERLNNKLRILNNMKLRSVQLPFNSRIAQLQLFKEKYKNSHFDQPLHAPKPQLKTAMDMLPEELSTRFKSGRDRKRTA